MEGFSGAGPISVKVTWTATEVVLYNPVQTAEGLRADTKDPQGLITRWFAPWTSVTYIKQTLSAAESGLGNPDVPYPL